MSTSSKINTKKEASNDEFFYQSIEPSGNPFLIRVATPITVNTEDGTILAAIVLPYENHADEFVGGNCAPYSRWPAGTMNGFQMRCDHLFAYKSIHLDPDNTQAKLVLFRYSMNPSSITDPMKALWDIKAIEDASKTGIQHEMLVESITPFGHDRYAWSLRYHALTTIQLQDGRRLFVQLYRITTVDDASKLQQRSPNPFKNHSKYECLVHEIFATRKYDYDYVLQIYAIDEELIPQIMH